MDCCSLKTYFKIVCVIAALVIVLYCLISIGVVSFDDLGRFARFSINFITLPACLIVYDIV